MRIQGVLIILLSIVNLSFQTRDNLSEEEIYAKILTEYLGQIIDNEDEIKSIILTKKLKKESLGEELSYNDLGRIYSASKSLLIIDENNIARPDSLKIDLVNKFERSTVRKKVNLREIKLPYEIELISSKTVKRRFRKNVKKGWENIYKKYPKSFGIFEISNLVFSDDRRFCILYVGYSRGGLNGYGCLLIADLENEKIIKTEIELWVS